MDSLLQTHSDRGPQASKTKPTRGNELGNAKMASWVGGTSKTRSSLLLHLLLVGIRAWVGSGCWIGWEIFSLIRVFCPCRLGVGLSPQLLLGRSAGILKKFRLFRTVSLLEILFP